MLRRVAHIFVVVTVVVAAAVLGGGCVLGWLGGASSRAPAELTEGLSPAAKALLEAAHAGIDGARLLDYHTHIVGLGQGGSGNWVNPDMRSWLSPIRRLKFAVYVDAAGVAELEQADAQYIERLQALIDARPLPGRYRVLAFDHHYHRDGTPNLEKSEFYVPNAYVFGLAERRPDIFEPVMSIHPYRPDAIAELERWAARGGRMLKWLPNAMGIDPADARLDLFYDRLRELGVVLLTHAGEEKAVEAEEDQELGNPLRLRRALDRGVRVVVAHCASLGEGEDLDDPARPTVTNLELFLRLLDEPRYEGLLFGDISALTQANRVGKPLTTILDRRDLHARLVNGSDYPLPAINVVIRTGKLASAGYLTSEEAEQLNEIYDFNPLLFDFVLKRTVRSPGTGARFDVAVFHEHPKLQ